MYQQTFKFKLRKMFLTIPKIVDLLRGLVSRASAEYAEDADSNAGSSC